MPDMPPADVMLDFLLKSVSGAVVTAAHSHTDADVCAHVLVRGLQAQFEFKLKANFQKLLRNKRDKWVTSVSETQGMLNELSDYFTGASSRASLHPPALALASCGRLSRVFDPPPLVATTIARTRVCVCACICDDAGELALTRVKRDEHLMAWFAKLSRAVGEMDFDRPIVAGRTIGAVIVALDNCETFESIATRCVCVSAGARCAVASSRELCVSCVVLSAAVNTSRGS
jgi:hypothetical protein